GGRWWNVCARVRGRLRLPPRRRQRHGDCPPPPRAPRRARRTGPPAMTRLLPLFALALTPVLRLGDAAPKYPPPEQVKAAFLKLLDRPKVDLDGKLQRTSADADFEILAGDFASEKKPGGQIERVPVLIVKPAKLQGRAPTVICLHGTSGNKEGQLPLLKELARRGLVG